MAKEFRQFDEQGFPVPPRYEDLKYHDDEPPPRPKVNMRVKRWVLILLLLGVVVPVVFGPHIIAAGRGALARWFSTRAVQKYDAGNIRGALAELNQAIEWNPDALELYVQRATWRQELNELDGSLDDWNKTIELLETQEVPQPRRWERFADRSERLAYAHSSRSWVYVRLDRQKDALDDANRAVALFRCPETLNSRAYARAILNVELDEGLDDIEKALAESIPQEPSYLDTRGYLLHLLGRNDEALKDMQQAITISEEMKSRSLRGQFRLRSQREFVRELQRLDHNLAVMYHHRGLIYKALGRNTEGDRDLRRAEQLGYDPANGVL